MPRHIRRVRQALEVLASVFLMSLLPTVASAQVPNCPFSAALGCFAIDGTITDASNSGVAGALITDDSIKTGNKELGPVNGSHTKVGVIHATQPPPAVLGLTSINSQTDLLKVYTQTARDTTGDIWYYFGWTRGSANGSGFISVEFNQNKAPAACDYTLSQASLIAGCNPWKNRMQGDFMILWDQNGNSLTIIKRIFDEVNGQVVLPACPTGWPGNAAVADTAFCVRILASNVLASYGAGDFSRGEMSINLSEEVFGESGACKNFANIIPNTVTGNSDTADYKDTVLRDFPDITNCGTVTVTKVTSPAGLTDEFTYRLTRGDGDIFNGTGIDDDCLAASSTSALCVGTIKHGETDTITNVLASTLYGLTEDANASYSTAIKCTFKGADYYAPAGQGQTPFPFPVEALETTACVITNTFLKEPPNFTSVQYARLYDTITFTGIIPGGSGGTDYGSVVVSLHYEDNACGAASQVGVSSSLSVLSTGMVTTLNDVAMPVSKTGTYYWAFTYNPGTAVNDPLTIADTCGLESFTIGFSPNQP